MDKSKISKGMLYNTLLMTMYNATQCILKKIGCVKFKFNNKLLNKENDSAYITKYILLNIYVALIIIYFATSNMLS